MVGTTPFSNSSKSRPSAMDPSSPGKLRRVSLRTPTPPSAPTLSNIGDPNLRASKRLSRYDLDQVALPQDKSPKSPVFYAGYYGFGAGSNRRDDDQRRSAFSHYVMSQDDREMKMHQVWLEKRSEDASNAQADSGIKRSLEKWTMHMARVEEEIARRQESSRYGSRTPRFRLYPNNPAPRDMGRPNSSASSHVTVVTSGQKEPVTEQLTRSQSFEMPKEGEQLPISKQVAAAPPEDDGYSTEDDADIGPILEHAVVAEVSTPAIQNTIWLSPYKNIDYKKLHMAPPFRDDEKAVRGFKSPHPETRQPPIPETGHNAPGEVRPGSAPVPSVHRLVQLDECKRILDAFSRHNIPCPRDVLERALLIPEDRPYEDCVLILPKSGSGAQRTSPSEKASNRSRGARPGKAPSPKPSDKPPRRS